MKLQKSNEDIIKLSEYIEKNPEKYSLWTRNELGKYHIYIFSVMLDKVEELNFLWEKLTNDLAVNFQSKLEENIELWNVYVVFFVKEKVDKTLKYTIQQDLYSSRKIVIDNFKPRYIEKYVLLHLEKKLFRLKINTIPKVKKSNDEHSMEEMINNKDKSLLKMLANTDDLKVVINNYLEVE